MPAVHTEVLAGHGETCRYMSAAAGASGNWVLASLTNLQMFYSRPGGGGGHKRELADD